jgi:MFS family permease
MHQTIAQKPDTRQGWYVVGICTLAYIFSFIDRQILSLLVGPIKLDLGLTDTSFAFLHGFAFSIFYATLGVPIAGLADRMARPLVIAGALRCGRWQRRPAGWRAAFPSLLARMMVGAGEAALSPAAYALINDLFPREKLGRAIGVYSLGSFLGAGLALLVGGALVAMAGSNSAVMVGAWSLRVWQMCFLVVGLPGLLLAALVWLTVREPAPRKGGGQEGAPPPCAPCWAIWCANGRFSRRICWAMPFRAGPCSGCSPGGRRR